MRMTEGSLYIGGQQYDSLPQLIDTEVSFTAVLLLSNSQLYRERRADILCYASRCL